MKPKTKKILIIAAAVAAVAIIVFLIVRKSIKGKSATVISKLAVSNGMKQSLLRMIDYIEKNWDAESKKKIETKAKENGRSVEQQYVIEAAYALWQNNQMSAEDYNEILSQVQAL